MKAGLGDEVVTFISIKMWEALMVYAYTLLIL
jgi:hypothetical protein